MSKKSDRIDARIKEIDQLLAVIDWVLIGMVSAPIVFCIVILGLVTLKWLGCLT